MLQYQISKTSGDTSKKFQKIKFENYLNNNFELVPDILKKISKSKKDKSNFCWILCFHRIY